jgi:hypothetical protein
MKRTAIQRRTPLRKRNPKRRARLYARNFGAHADTIRALPCLVLGCQRRAEACHARPRGMGGANGSWRDLVPLCREHHIEAGEHRTTQRYAFELRHGVSLTLAAARLASGVCWTCEGAGGRDLAGSAWSACRDCQGLGRSHRGGAS